MNAQKQSLKHSLFFMSFGFIMVVLFQNCGSPGLQSSNSSSLIYYAETLSSGHGFHSCASFTLETVKCWGGNDFGQLGDGSSISKILPVDSIGVSNVKAVTAGENHTCALLMNGKIKCWGSNDHGQLGDGSKANKLLPTLIDLTNVKAMALGSSHTCALLNSESVKCWGNNQNGQLGDGTTDDRLTPTTVPGLSQVINISAGATGTCAALSNGTIKCWGDNTFGQLGDGTTTNRPTPTTVTGISTAKAASLGSVHGCALLSNQKVKCWGNNENGRLGNGNPTSMELSPVDVMGADSAVSLSVGYNHSCAALGSGQILCWGENQNGELGDGSGDSFNSVPVFAQNIVKAKSVSTGLAHTCALVENGKISCWGGNFSAQLGDGTQINKATPIIVQFDK